MSLYLGIDTSNYTTSAALFDYEAFRAKGVRQLLKVREGAKGLRQSDALYEHVKSLPALLDSLGIEGGSLRAVGFSSRPRDMEGSYMPCFEAGILSGRSIAAACGIPYYEFSHQAGHIASALFSVNRLDMMDSEFLAFHVSGGTTEAVYCRPEDGELKTCIVAQSLDLKAGQAVDRVGGMLGLGFPAGAQLEKLALQSDKSFKVRPCLKGADCCLSGLENLCMEMIDKKSPACDTAKFCIDYIKATLEGMLLALRPQYGKLPVLFAGGVMSDSLIREYFVKKYGAVFALPEYSTDNAVGISVLTGLKDVNG
jgi:N6-L-threonylcarbamoyladenine synthase